MLFKCKLSRDMLFRSNINKYIMYKLGKKAFYSSCKPQHILFFEFFSLENKNCSNEKNMIYVSLTLEISN